MCVGLVQFATQPLVQLQGFIHFEKLFCLLQGLQIILFTGGLSTKIVLESLCCPFIKGEELIWPLEDKQREYFGSFEWLMHVEASSLFEVS